MPQPSLDIRPAKPADIELLIDFIRDLAAHEGRPELATITPDILTDLLFGTRPLGEAFIATLGGEPAAYAIIAERFTSFRGTRLLYIEDMLVRPAYRGSGAGRQMLAFLARLVGERGCDRLEWSALDDNHVALGFYDHIGAETESGVVHFSLRGDALTKLAEQYDG